VSASVRFIYPLFILAEEIDSASAAHSQAGGDEPGPQMDAKVLQLLAGGLPLPLGLLRQSLLHKGTK